MNFQTGQNENISEKIKADILNQLKWNFGTNIDKAAPRQLYKACAKVARDLVMETWAEYNRNCANARAKEVYYLSAEFLTGRFLQKHLIDLSCEKAFSDACSDLGFNIESIIEMEPEPGLGSGGLGRLAACFMDSLATMGYRACGLGIRYQYGLFEQRIMDGWQVELPDSWLEEENLWEIERSDEAREIKFGGRVTTQTLNGRLTFKHEDYFSVLAVPYDIPVTGYKNGVVNTLRLWSARSRKLLDLKEFNQGRYLKAVEEKSMAEAITQVLYPEDSHYEGKALRIKQHYFFVSASIQNIVQNFKKRYGDLSRLPEYVAIQINDTHPAMAIPELMRILLDEEEFDWETAWDITSRTIAYTNHTVMEEALEKWPVSMFQMILPRLYMIVHEINERFCSKLWRMYPGQWQRIGEMAVIAYEHIRMANLAIAGSCSVNGVSGLHGGILKEQVFPALYQVFPEKFCSITNGINHRRWLLKANPELSALITLKIGDQWVTDPLKLSTFNMFANDSETKERIKDIRLQNKKKLAKYIKETTGIEVDPYSIFDVQIKRLHEYKRQILNILHILYLYNRIKETPGDKFQPRTFIFAAKASPGYSKAKLIIKLIHGTAELVNNDPDIQGRLKVVFLQNYCVSLAEKIIPASDINEQISTAGKEASGTGNMKFMFNGSLTIGTMDGANIEMLQAVGPEGIYMFGLTAERIFQYGRYGGYKPLDIYFNNPHLKKVLDQINDGLLSPDDTHRFSEIYNSLLHGNSGTADPYFVLKDFEDYIRTQRRIEEDYRDQEKWWSSVIRNIAQAGWFSSDRSISEYNEKVWGLKIAEYEKY